MLVSLETLRELRNQKIQVYSKYLKPNKKESQVLGLVSLYYRLRDPWGKRDKGRNLDFKKNRFIVNT